MPRHPGYPFEPKSMAHIRPGDFWGIPTRRGGWCCCGQVLGFYEWTTPRSLVVGLLDWCEPQPPTAEAISGAAVLRSGNAHFKTVRKTGGMLLGSAEPPAVAGIDDPNLVTWGYKVIEGLAHEHFGRHFPESPVPAIERPAGFAS
ncbi:hypothetical protein OWR29_23800 [Actinoplanes sp. Pm04-4]|uniref:Uncharacterized protein n=1 Tax=Paractinoplanes pyxinae TaxID=2997416 RepID=A0ABT4B3F7_9ACTN|nr:hypothetical protein [Actinoplanes pyxinae]MCY1141033.1 hypothetical protein [Actinoplanes pyxinae]